MKLYEINREQFIKKYTTSFQMEIYNIPLKNNELYKDKNSKKLNYSYKYNNTILFNFIAKKLKKYIDHTDINSNNIFTIYSDIVSNGGVYRLLKELSFLMDRNTFERITPIINIDDKYITLIYDNIYLSDELNYRIGHHKDVSFYKIVLRVDNKKAFRNFLCKNIDNLYNIYLAGILHNNKKLSKRNRIA